MNENTTTAEEVKVEDTKAEKKFSWSSLVPSKHTMLIGGAVVVTITAAVVTYIALDHNGSEAVVADASKASSETI
jgi:hypothetical protein